MCGPRLAPVSPPGSAYRGHVCRQPSGNSSLGGHQSELPLPCRTTPGRPSQQPRPSPRWPLEGRGCVDSPAAEPRVRWTGRGGGGPPGSACVAGARRGCRGGRRPSGAALGALGRAGRGPWPWLWKEEGGGPAPTRPSCRPPTPAAARGRQQSDAEPRRRGPRTPTPPVQPRTPLPGARAARAALEGRELRPAAAPAGPASAGNFPGPSDLKARPRTPCGGL